MRVLLPLLLLLATCLPSNSSNWALDFDGVNDIAVVPGVTFSYWSLTVEAWVYPRGTSAHAEVVGIADRTQIYFQLERWFDGLLFDPGGTHCRLYTDDPVVTVDEWQHIAAVYELPTVTIYVNAVPVATRECDYGYEFTINGQELIIGREITANYWWWDGAIDELRIWTVALTQAQIADAMCGQLSGAEDGLLGCWTFDEGEGQVIHDTGPSGFHGRLGLTPEPDSLDPAWVPGYECATPVEGRSWARIKALHR